LPASHAPRTIVSIHVDTNQGTCDGRDMANVEYEINAVLAGAYPKASDLRNCLTHAVIGGKALCGKVKPESLCDDMYEESYRHNEGEPTCKGCASKLAKLRK
jgi:hypothetical protein